jgi:hypothetical protein
MIALPEVLRIAREHGSPLGYRSAWERASAGYFGVMEKRGGRVFVSLEGVEKYFAAKGSEAVPA